MTRIISGFAGSIAITVPRAGTRPTSDRVREAIFSALQSRGGLHGARVLDLYAGSGALGLEAASRGASAVTLVERHPAAVTVCRANASRVLGQAPPGRAPSIQVVGRSVQSFLESATSHWDLVLIDPPYNLPDAQLAENLLALAPLLSPDAVVMLERSSRSAAPALPAGLAVDRHKSYGDTTLWWLNPA